MNSRNFFIYSMIFLVLTFVFMIFIKGPSLTGYIIQSPSTLSADEGVKYQACLKEEKHYPVIELNKVECKKCVLSTQCETYDDKAMCEQNPCRLNCEFNEIFDSCMKRKDGISYYKPTASFSVDYDLEEYKYLFSKIEDIQNQCQTPGSMSRDTCINNLFIKYNTERAGRYHWDFVIEKPEEKAYYNFIENIKQCDASFDTNCICTYDATDSLENPIFIDVNFAGSNNFVYSDDNFYFEDDLTIYSSQDYTLPKEVSIKPPLIELKFPNNAVKTVEQPIIYKDSAGTMQFVEIDGTFQNIINFFDGTTHTYYPLSYYSALSPDQLSCLSSGFKAPITQSDGSVTCVDCSSLSGTDPYGIDGTICNLDPCGKNSAWDGTTSSCNYGDKKYVIAECAQRKNFKIISVKDTQTEILTNDDVAEKIEKKPLEYKFVLGFNDIAPLSLTSGVSAFSKPRGEKDIVMMWPKDPNVIEYKIFYGLSRTGIGEVMSFSKTDTTSAPLYDGINFNNPRIEHNKKSGVPFKFEIIYDSLSGPVNLLPNKLYQTTNKYFLIYRDFTMPEGDVYMQVKSLTTPTLSESSPIFTIRNTDTLQPRKVSTFMVSKVGDDVQISFIKPKANFDESPLDTMQPIKYEIYCKYTSDAAMNFKITDMFKLSTIFQEPVTQPIVIPKAVYSTQCTTTGYSNSYLHFVIVPTDGKNPDAANLDTYVTEMIDHRVIT